MLRRRGNRLPFAVQRVVRFQPSRHNGSKPDVSMLLALDRVGGCVYVEG